MTYGAFVNDIMIALGYSIDDATRTRANVAFNVMMAINKVKDQFLTKAMSVDLREGADQSQTFIVNLATQADLNRRYFDLPTEIYSLPTDGGVDRIGYYRNNLPANCSPSAARTPFTIITTSQLAAYWGTTHQGPNESRPYVTRESSLNDGVRTDRVYVWGVNPLVTQLEVGLFVALGNVDDMPPDETINLPIEKLDLIKKLVLSSEGWLLNIPQDRLLNDGRDLAANQVVHTPPPVSVNHPVNLSDAE
jgi:hypothetical protein